MKYSATRSVTWGFILVVICMGIFIWFTYANMQDTLREGKSVRIALKSLHILETVQEEMHQMENAERGYVITGNRQELAPYLIAIREIQADSVILQTLLADDSTRRQKLEILQVLVRKKIAFSEDIIRTRDSAGYEMAVGKIKTGLGREIMDSIHALIDSTEASDRAVLRNSNARQLKKAEFTSTLFFILSGIFFLVFAISYFIIQRNLRRQQHYQAELQYLSTLVKQTSETIFSTDPDFIIRSWNKAAEKMYHYTWKDAVGKSKHSLFTVCLNEGQKSALLATLRLNGFYNGEFNVILRNGQTISVEASITVLLDANGKIDGYVAVHKDITDRKKLEDELHKLNEGLEEKVATKTAELTHIFERITDAFVALDNDWCYTYVNQRAGEIINMAPAELIGKNIWEIFPDGKSQQLIERCRQAVAEQQYYYLEEYYPKIGKWFENHLYPSPKGLSIFFRDITEEKKAEQALHESGEKYRSLIELATDAILINQDGLIQYANPAALQLFGFSGNEELIDKKFSDLFQPDYHQLIDKWVAALMATGNSNFLLEEKVIRADGNLIDVEVVANLFNFKGRPAIEMVIRNLSERKETEKKLKASDKIFNHSVDLLCIVGSDGYFKVVNPAWTKILGWTTGELLTKTWIEFVHPDDRERSQNPGFGFEKEESISHIENRYLCKDGTWKWVAWNSFAYPMEHEIFGVGRDITSSKKIEKELFESNQLFQNLAKVSPVGIFRTGPDGDSLYVNERWCTIAGMSAAESLGKDWQHAIHPDDKERVFKQWYSNDFKKENFKIEYRFMQPNGIVTWVMGQAAAEFNNAGDIIGFVGSVTDISELKMAEGRLRKLSTAVEQSSASIVITDVKGDIEYVNPAFSKTSGYSFEESLGKNPRILQSGLTDSKVHEQLWQNIISAVEWNGVFCNRKKNGELYWESATISPIVNDAGDITNFVAVKENITDKIKAEEQLHKEKVLSDSIINSLPGIFYLYDETGKFIRWNKNFETVSEYTAQEIKAMHPMDFYGPDELLQIQKRIDTAFVGQTMPGAEVLLQTRTKKKIPFFINSLTVVYEGKNCIMGTGIDIAARKIAEEENKKLAMIASLTINAVILTNATGYIQWVNKGFERITEFTFDEVLGKKPGNFLHGPETDLRTVAFMRKCIREGRGFKVELVNYNKRGLKYWLDIEVVPILNEQNILTGFMAIERDISDRKFAEEELLILNQSLQDRAKQLALSNIELEQFAYVASHDLQEPLRMVSSFMNLLKRNYQAQLDNKASQYIDFAADGAVRMKQLIMDLLEYSRVGTNKDVFINTDMNKVVQEVVQIFVKQEEGEIPEISFPVLPVVMANKSQITQLFQNLVGNAIKYKRAQKALIHINYTEDKSYFTFSVSDNGIGIDPVHYERIFILFQRLHLKDEYSGTGIGLTICKKIVEKHGGTIWVESKPGKGSTFYFTIKKQL